MDLKKYEILIRVVELGNMTRAAYELGYTQSGISHTIHNIERDLGFPLLLRSKKGVSLTHEGERVLPKIRTLLEANRALDQHIADVIGLRNGSVHIGAFQSVASRWLLPVIDAFRKNYPRVGIHIIDGTSSEMERMLIEGTLDLGIFCPGQQTVLRKELLKEDPYMAVVPLNHPHARSSHFPLDELTTNDFILGSMSTTAKALKKAQVPIHASITTVDNMTAIEMVAAGMGISLVPELELELTPISSVVAIPLDRPITRDVCLTHATDEPGPAAAVFLDYCHTILPTIIK